MSVTIAGIDKPTNCSSCFFKQNCETEDMSRCPIIEAKTPRALMSCKYCGKQKVYAKGYCINCYVRFNKYGTPEYRHLQKRERHDDWEKTLSEDLFGEAKDPTELNPTLVDAIGTIHPKDQAVLLEHYRDGKSLSEIGREMNLSRERIRQIKLRGIARLKKRYARGVYRGLEEMKVVTGLEEMDLSVRAFNCLWRSGIRTVEGLKAYVNCDDPFNQLRKIRNLGTKCAEEVLIALNETRCEV